MQKKNIIVAGAGFGGITAVLKLASKTKKVPEGYHLILTDKYHHQLYTPALYEIAAMPRENAPDQKLKSSVLIPVSDIIGRKSIEFICDELIGLKPPENKIILKNRGEVPFEFLVLALGSETNYFGIPGLAENGFALKTFDDGIRLRDAAENLMLRKNELKTVVGGGGASGVETSAEFVNFFAALKKKLGKKELKLKLVLVEAAAEILSGFDAAVISKARKRLARLGVEIKTCAAIASVSANEIIFKDGVKENYDLLAWTGGVKGPSVFQNFGLALGRKGNLSVDEYLHAKGSKNIFVIGDSADFDDPRTQKSLPWNVPAAEIEGTIVSENIIRGIRSLPLEKFVPPKKFPFILAISKKYAIADLVFIKFSGFWGWLLKQMVELRYLLFILPFKKALAVWLRGLRYFVSND